MKDDQDVFAQVPGLIFLTFTQSFAGRHHQDDRNNPPGDTEHGQERAQFVRPKGTQHIANEVAKIHAVMDGVTART